MDEADSSCRFYHHQTVPMLPPFKFFIRVKSHNLSPYFSTIPIMQKTRLSEAVKALTSSAHQALEKRLVIIIRQIGSVEDYRRLLLLDRKSTRLNSSHLVISYAVFCLKKKKKNITTQHS